MKPVTNMHTVAFFPLYIYSAITIGAYNFVTSMHIFTGFCVITVPAQNVRYAWRNVVGHLCLYVQMSLVFKYSYDKRETG